MWRAFADEITTEGVHVILTNDDTLNEVTIKNVYTGALRRFGKIARVKTQDELEKWCTDEVRKLEETETSNLVLRAFVPIAPIETPVIDPKRAAELALRDALSNFELARRVWEADPTYDLTKYKQAVADAQNAIDAMVVK